MSLRRRPAEAATYIPAASTGFGLTPSGALGFSEDVEHRISSMTSSRLSAAPAPTTTTAAAADGEKGITCNRDAMSMIRPFASLSMTNAGFGMYHDSDEEEMYTGLPYRWGKEAALERYVQDPKAKESKKNKRAKELEIVRAYCNYKSGKYHTVKEYAEKDADHVPQDIFKTYRRLKLGVEDGKVAKEFFDRIHDLKVLRSEMMKKWPAYRNDVMGMYKQAEGIVTKIDEMWVEYNIHVNRSEKERERIEQRKADYEARRPADYKLERQNANVFPKQTQLQRQGSIQPPAKSAPAGLPRSSSMPKIKSEPKHAAMMSIPQMQQAIRAKTLEIQQRLDAQRYLGSRMHDDEEEEEEGLYCTCEHPQPAPISSGMYCTCPNPIPVSVGAAGAKAAAPVPHHHHHGRHQRNTHAGTHHLTTKKGDNVHSASSMYCTCEVPIPISVNAAGNTKKPVRVHVNQEKPDGNHIISSNGHDNKNTRKHNKKPENAHGVSHATHSDERPRNTQTHGIKGTTQPFTAYRSARSQLFPDDDAF